MTGRKVFKVWAPEASVWSQWVRPVLFICIDCSEGAYSSICPDIPQSYYLNGVSGDTAIIIDLPGVESIIEALATAKTGYRPIPLFNGTTGQPGAISLVDNYPLIRALIWGAGELRKMNISDDAPPAFLLDSNRVNKHKMNVSVYDNSWDIYEQDMPSADFLLRNRIKKIIIHSRKIYKDLAKILFKYRKKGIDIYITDGYSLPRKINVRKPIR